MKHYIRLSDPCWETSRAKNNAGYTQVSVNGKPQGGHRLVYEALFGPIPEGMDIDHLCKNRACWNPWHCEPVTRRENLKRGNGVIAERLGRDHCIKGHDYTTANTYMYKGHRLCRTCRAGAARKHRRNTSKL